MRVHRNLHNARVGGPQWTETVRGKVARYLESVVLLDVTTRIQPAGARKCRERQRRKVCAFLDGRESQALPAGLWMRVGYDPRKDHTFLAEGRPWNTADAVDLRADGSSWVLNPRYR